MKTLIALFSTVLLFSCGGGGGSSNSSMGNEEQKQFVLDVMSDYYLFYDQMPTIDLRDYDSPEAVLDALIVDPPDRFSYIGNRVVQENLFQAGTFEGIGYGRRFNDDDTQTILYVFDDSAAGRPCPESSAPSCLQRGDIILDISPSGNDFTFDINRNGDLFTATLTSGLVRINTVLEESIITQNGRNIGYLALTNFLQTTVAELNSAFADFNQGGIDELVLDLRYNGGGLVSTAQLLASYIAGINGNGSDVARLEWNDRNTQENDRYEFTSPTNQLNLSRLYVLTLGGTCSASELVINAMEGISGVEVITIGQTTCGKPVGSVSFNFGDKVLQPITFRVVNDVGNGDYFDGIDPSFGCTSEDDVTKQLTDPEETLYAAALEHIAIGNCGLTVARASRYIEKNNDQLHHQSRYQYNPDPMANLF